MTSLCLKCYEEADLILVVGKNSRDANPSSTIFYRLFVIQGTIFYSFDRIKQAPIASHK